MKFLGHPILGDVIYGTRTKISMCLFALGLKFVHPFTQAQIDIQLDDPEDGRLTMLGEK